MATFNASTLQPTPQQIVRVSCSFKACPFPAIWDYKDINAVVAVCTQHRDFFEVERGNVDNPILQTFAEATGQQHANHASSYIPLTGGYLPLTDDGKWDGFHLAKGRAPWAEPWESNARYSDGRRARRPPNHEGKTQLYSCTYCLWTGYVRPSFPRCFQCRRRPPKPNPRTEPLDCVHCGWSGLVRPGSSSHCLQCRKRRPRGGGYVYRSRKPKPGHTKYFECVNCGWTGYVRPRFPHCLPCHALHEHLRRAVKSGNFVRVPSLKPPRKQRMNRPNSNDPGALFYHCKMCGWRGYVRSRPRCLECSRRRVARYRKSKPI